MKPLYSYRIGSGWNVSLSSLVNVELITQIARPPSKVLPVSIFPVRTQVLSNAVFGDGSLSLTWQFDSLLITGLNYIISTYLTTSTLPVASKKVTIYTNNRDRALYTRYNCYLVYPESGNDYTLDGLYALNLKLKFSGLTALS
jgi:hypothetical protein